MALKRNRTYSYNSNIAITFLWTGALLLFALMFYIWQLPKGGTSSVNTGNLSVDELLLSPKDFQLGQKTSLININLNTIFNENEKQTETEILKEKPNRKIIYNNILQEKIKKLPKENSYGFTIKTIPQ